MPAPFGMAAGARTSAVLCLVFISLVCSLAGCGGQAGGSSLSGDETKRNTILKNTPAGLTQLEGLYKGNLINTSDEFLILVAPDTGSNVQAFAWYRKASQPLVAHLYHGPLTLGSVGQASSGGATWKIVEGSNNYPGTATITGASLSAMIADISISRNATVATSQMVVSALPSNDYGFNNAPPNLRNTTWTGSWSSRGNNTGSSLIFDGAANPGQSITIEGCTYASNQQTWVWAAHPSGKNIFNVQLSLVSGGLTSCFWAGKPLSGPAIVSQQNGQTQLDMMLLDGMGAGISYRGTR
jgi:hypothetical protein